MGQEVNHKTKNHSLNNLVLVPTMSIILKELEIDYRNLYIYIMTQKMQSIYMEKNLLKCHDSFPGSPLS